VRAPLLLLPLAAALSACIPSPGGQCSADADCGYGTTCQEGLCRKAPPRACQPACGAGFHCGDGTCALDTAPVVTWLSPKDQAFASGGAVALALTVQTPATDVAVQVIAEPVQAGTAQPLLVTLNLGSDGAYRGLLDAGQLQERLWRLRPVVTAASASWPAPAQTLGIDRSGPSVEVLVPSPQGAASFLRSQTITVTARVRDFGAGVAPETLAVVGEGMAPLAGQRVSQTDYTFQLPLSGPAFHAAEGPLAFAIRARDALGNETVQAASAPVTRLLWRRDVGSGLPVASSPVLDEARVFVGTGSAKVVALDRKAGVPLWSRQMNGPVSASPARGALLYAVSESGDVQALDPDSGAPQWTCPGLPSGLSFHASPALLAVPGLGKDGAALEALVLQNTGTFALSNRTVRGGLFVLQGAAGFPVAGGQRACFLLAETSGGRSSPAVSSEGRIFAGGDDQRAHALRLQADTLGAYSLIEEWSVPAADDLGASPALLDQSAAFADDQGNFTRLGPDGSLLTPGAVGQKLLSSPVIAFGAALLLGRDGALTSFQLATPALAGPALLSPAFAASATVEGASSIEATPAVGSDGTLYISAGHSLRALAPSGAVLWELPLAGASTASSPVVGCDGTLFVADASGALSAIATDSKGHAPGWPRFRHDARGTGNQATPACE
jgi:outer membrane protein assembly factor BamB